MWIPVSREKKREGKNIYVHRDTRIAATETVTNEIIY